MRAYVYMHAYILRVCVYIYMYINSNTLQLFSLQLYSEAAHLGEELVASRIHRINGSKGLPVSTK